MTTTATQTHLPHLLSAFDLGGLDFAQPRGHGPADARPGRTRARAERPDGGILHATRLGRADHHRGDRNLRTRLRLGGFAGHLQRRPGGWVEERSSPRCTPGALRSFSNSGTAAAPRTAAFTAGSRRCRPRPSRSTATTSTRLRASSLTRRHARWRRRRSPRWCRITGGRRSGRRRPGLTAWKFTRPTAT